MEYPDYKYRPKKRQKSGGQVNAVTSSLLNPVTNIKVEDRSEDSEDGQETPLKRFCSNNNQLKGEPASPSYSVPPTIGSQSLPDYFAPDITPPPKVPSPDMVSFT